MIHELELAIDAHNLIYFESIEATRAVCEYRMLKTFFWDPTFHYHARDIHCETIMNNSSPVSRFSSSFLPICVALELDSYDLQSRNQRLTPNLPVRLVICIEKDSVQFIRSFRIKPLASPNAGSILIGLPLAIPS